MREEKLINRGWQFALLPCKPVDFQTAKERDEKRKQSSFDLRSELGALSFSPVDLSHDWAVSCPFNKEMDDGAPQGFRDRWGIGWYKKTVTLEEKKEGMRYLLYFGGVYENATLWVNDFEIGNHKYGYSSFQMDITEAVKAGDNELLMRVDNSVMPADRWYSGCGIYRDVALHIVPEEHLDLWEIQVHIKIEGTDAIVEVETKSRVLVQGILCPIKSSGENDDVTIEVAEPNLSNIEETEVFFAESSEGLDGKLQFHVKNAKLWSADDPQLYRLILSTENDKVSVNIGIREVVFDAKKGMLVNGVPTKLKGVCLHQEAGCLGTAVTKEIWRERLTHLKKLGCNAIRAAHHTYSEEFLDLCDEMGFYVYEECFDKWKGGLYGRYFDKNWESDVEAMVKRDRNRACIVIWGVGNEVENQGQDSMLAILKQLSDKVRSLDSSRPITYAMNPHFKWESNVDLSKIKDIQQFVDEVSDTEIYDAKERVSRIAKIAEIVDIISCNYQEQWYELIHEQIPNKLILGTEVYVAYMLKSIWSEEPVVHFSVMDYSLDDEGVKEHWDSPIYADHWHFPQFRKTLIPYMIASNCDEVHLFLNGKQFFIPRPSECKNGIITGFLPWQPGTVTVVGYQNGKEACRHEVVTPGMAVALAFDQECDHKECVSTVNLGIPEKKQHLLLTVRAVDENGNSCFRESGKVHFAVEGAAKIVGVDNGDICSNEPYQEDSVHLYHGCASVMLELYCKPGRVSVHAFGDGLRQAQTIIEVCEK